MFVRMLYVSTAVGPVTTSVTGTILRSAQAFNSENGITGVLCQGQGVWMQILEGGRKELDALYGRIAADKRHKNVQLIALEDITDRRYGAWAMAHVEFCEADLPLTQKPADTVFDPYAATAARVMSHIDALIAAGKVMGAPVI